MQHLIYRLKKAIGAICKSVEFSESAPFAAWLIISLNSIWHFNRSVQITSVSLLKSSVLFLTMKCNWFEPLSTVKFGLLYFAAINFVNDKDISQLWHLLCIYFVKCQMTHLQSAFLLENVATSILFISIPFKISQPWTYCDIYNKLMFLSASAPSY